MFKLLNTKKMRIKTIENKPVKRFERHVKFLLNGIVMDEVLISYEKDIKSVVTFYDKDAPYAFKDVEADKKLTNPHEIRKEISLRARKWVKNFKTIMK